MDIQELFNRIKKEEVIPPGDLADLRMQLAGEFGLISAKLDTILHKKAFAWLEIRQREGIGSDKMADRIWDATEMGQLEMKHRSDLKAIDKVISSISSRLRVWEKELKNQY